jgi:hypothetical protein
LNLLGFVYEEAQYYLSIVFDFLEKARVKGTWEQLPDRYYLALTVEIHQFNTGILAKLPDDLPAGTTGRSQ